MTKTTTEALLDACAHASKVLPADLAAFVDAIFKSRALAVAVTGLPYREDQLEVKAARAILAMPLPTAAEIPDDAPELVKIHGTPYEVLEWSLRDHDTDGDGTAEWTLYAAKVTPAEAPEDPT